MDPRLRLSDSPRPGVHKALASTPLVTLAWQTLRSEHRRRAAETRRSEEDERRRLEKLADAAELVPRLRRVIEKLASNASDRPGDEHRRELGAIADRLEESLAEVQITVVAPVGEPYSAEMMDLLENLAQRVDPNARQPWIAEVIAPAVLHDGDLLRMGKAVIAVPPADGSGSEAADPTDPPPSTDDPA